MYIQIHKTSIGSEGVVQFLKHTLKHIQGKITVVWDGSPIHKSIAVKKFLSEESEGRLHLELLPPYAPDLNPAEGIWQYLKCVLLKNRCFQNLDQLENALRKAIRMFRSRKKLIKACFVRAGCV